jgi:hypothetical protein
MINEAMKSRLIDVINCVKCESDTNVKEWYPIDLLFELKSVIDNNARTTSILNTISKITYQMIDQFFSYEDSVFGLVMGYCYNLRALISLDSAIGILSHADQSAIHIEMANLLLLWRKAFSVNGCILEDIENKYSNMFCELVLGCYDYWNDLFPYYIIEALKSASDLKWKILFSSAK